MSRSDRYDYVLSEEYDDYEDRRRRCNACLAREQPPIRNNPPEIDPIETVAVRDRSPSPSDTAIVFNRVLFVFMVIAMLAIAVMVVIMFGSYYFRTDANSIFSKIAVPSIGCPTRSRNIATRCRVTDWFFGRANQKCRRKKCCNKQNHSIHPLEFVVQRLSRFLRFT